jgi:hypothetical protein
MTQLGIEPKQITVRDSIEVSVSVQAVGADLATVSAHVSRAGTDQPLREIRAPDKERQSLSFKVPLEPGSNVITVSARDAESRNREQRLEIVREDVAPKLVAVVIGVQNYAHVDPLRFAAPDARSVKKTLLALGLKNDDAHLFYREDADLGTLRHALATWLPRNAGPNDIAIVYFAGHGAVSSDGMAEEGDTISKYLLPVGAVLNDLYSTALPMDELSRILSRQKAGTLIFLLDACFSGAAGSRTVRQAGRLTANLDAEFLSRMAQGGRLVFTASGANEAADERAELDGGHGVFTYYLLKALGGAADVNQDGTVDQVEMISWVSGEVRTLTARKQNPEMYGEIRHPIPLWRKPR